MLSYEAALDKLYDAVDGKLETISLKVDDAFGFITATEVKSKVNISPFDNSAMDGFALSIASLVEGENIFEVSSSNFAGDEPDFAAQHAMEIMTGAMVPEQFDCVVKIEDITILEIDDTGTPLKISLTFDGDNIRQGQNIRYKGEDYKVGDVLIPSSQRLLASELAVLKSAGVAEVEVISKPKIAIISTGKELVDDPNQALRPGQIRNSNSINLVSLLKAQYIEDVKSYTILDDENEYLELVKKLNNDHDIIISTGAVSMGRHDFIPQSVAELGGEVIFHKAKIRPGKPILFAKFAAVDQKSPCYYFGLPGNPASANVGFTFFANKLIEVIQGLKSKDTIFAKLDAPLFKKHGFKMFYKAYLYLDDAMLKAKILTGQESFKLSSLIRANAWVEIEEEQNETEAGSLVKCHPLLDKDGLF